MLRTRREGLAGDSVRFARGQVYDRGLNAKSDGVSPASARSKPDQTHRNQQRGVGFGNRTDGGGDLVREAPQRGPRGGGTSAAVDAAEVLIQRVCLIRRGRNELQRSLVGDDDSLSGQLCDDRVEGNEKGQELVGTYHMHRVGWEHDSKRDTPTKLDAVLAEGSGLIMFIISMVDPSSPIIKAFYEGVTELDRTLYGKDVAFVGAWDRERERMLENLADLNLGVWGPGWNRVRMGSPLRKSLHRRY